MQSHQHHRTPEATLSSARSRSRRTAIVLASLLAVAIAAVLGVRQAAFRAVERSGLQSPPNGRETPAAWGVPFDTVWITSGGRRLLAYWAPPVPVVAIDSLTRALARRRAPAILIYHGTNESVSHWAKAQARLARAGIASMVFDYSGFGSSEGEARVRTVREDAVAAWQAFDSVAGRDGPRHALGYSLGSGVLLESLGRLQPYPDGVIVMSAYTSAREAAVRMRLIDPRLRWLIPDVWNNVREVRRVRAPLLVVHGTGDHLLPVDMAHAIHAAAPEPRSLALLDGFHHTAAWDEASEAFWGPVIEFAKRGGAGPRNP